jgi:hypothetical protein
VTQFSVDLLSALISDRNMEGISLTASASVVVRPNRSFFLSRADIFTLISPISTICCCYQQCWIDFRMRVSLITLERIGGMPRQFPRFHHQLLSPLPLCCAVLCLPRNRYCISSCWGEFLRTFHFKMKMKMKSRGGFQNRTDTKKTKIQLFSAAPKNLKIQKQGGVQ